MDEIIEALLEAIMKWAEDNKENFDVVVIVPVDNDEDEYDDVLMMWTTTN